MNKYDVARKFVQGEPCRAASLMSTGTMLISFQTPIAIRLPSGRIAAVQTSFSSSFTGQHRSALMQNVTESSDPLTDAELARIRTMTAGQGRMQGNEEWRVYV